MKINEIFDLTLAVCLIGVAAGVFIIVQGILQDNVGEAGATGAAIISVFGGVGAAFAAMRAKKCFCGHNHASHAEYRKNCKKCDCKRFSIGGPELPK